MYLNLKCRSVNKNQIVVYLHHQKTFRAFFRLRISKNEWMIEMSIEIMISIQGYLQRLSSTASSRRWCRRWFVLKKSGQLSWYMQPGETDPLGAFMADNVRVERVVELGAEHAFKVTFTFAGGSHKNNGNSVVVGGGGGGGAGGGTYFAADDEDSATKWIMAFKKMANPSLTV